MPINVSEKNCCGCLACLQSCPTKAIKVMPNIKGFILPVVDTSKCINCGKCEAVCSFKKDNINKNSLIDSYALKARDNNTLKESTSGGAFTLLSDAILNKNGEIVSTLVNEDFEAAFSVAKSKEQRDRMRGSFYVQSLIDDKYLYVKKRLYSGCNVLFVGTPCQVGGLISFLGETHDNLYTVEILCHGVPNNNLFKEHISILEAKTKKKIKKYTFRSKKYAWWTHGVVDICYEDGSHSSNYEAQSFLYFFQNNWSLRECCFECPYKTKDRCADITIGDLWNGVHSNKERTIGVSLVAINSTNGNVLFEQIKEMADATRIDRNSTIKAFTTKTFYPKQYEEFWKEYFSNGYKGLEKRFYPKKVKVRLKFELKRLKAFLDSIHFNMGDRNVGKRSE